MSFIHIWLQMVCSNGTVANMYVWVCLCGSLRLTYCSISNVQVIQKVESTDQTNKPIQLHISSTSCQVGWYASEYQRRPPDQVPDSDDWKVVCRPCSYCDNGVVILSECTQSHDALCSKRCVNPAYVYDESTKSCQRKATVLAGKVTSHKYDYKSPLHHMSTRTSDTNINRMPLRSEGFAIKFAEGSAAQKGTQIKYSDGVSQQHKDDGDVPEHSVIYKDPNVLFVASGVIFLMLLAMLTPQVIEKLQQSRFVRRRQLRPGKFDINGQCSRHVI